MVTLPVSTSMGSSSIGTGFADGIMCESMMCVSAESTNATTTKKNIDQIRLNVVALKFFFNLEEQSEILIGHDCLVEQKE